MLRSLRLRLLGATILVILLAVGVTAFVASQRTWGEFQRYVEYGGSSRTKRFGFYVARNYGTHQSWDGIQAQVIELAQISGQRVVVADDRGKIVGDSGDPTL